MMMDTHAHLYLPPFADDLDSVIEKCRENKVEKVFLPNIDQHTITDLFQLCDDHPNFFYPMLGLHPCSVKEDYKLALNNIKNQLTDRRIYAIGEIGLDYYWDLSFKEAQIAAFRMQINWAKDLGLPIVIHSRESLDDVLKILKEEKSNQLFGICHCFTGTVEQAKIAIDLGFKLGIGGVVTFKNSGLDKTLKVIDLEHLVLETDAPYLAPVPFRGKRNESSYIQYIAQKISEIKEMEMEKVATITTENALQVFGL